MNDNDVVEIDLIEVFKLFWKKKWAILIPCFIAAILVVAFCVVSLKMPPEKSLLPNKYTAVSKVLVIEDSSSGGVSLSNGLSSLASLAGVSVGGGGASSNGQMLLTLAATTTYKDSIIEKFNLIEKWEIEEHVKTKSRKALDKVFSLSLGEDDNVLSISFIDIDPAFAKEVVDYATDLLVSEFYSFTKENNLIKKANYEAAMASSYQKILDYQKEIQRLESSVSNIIGTNVTSIMMDVQMTKLELEAEEQIYASFKGSYEMLCIEINNQPQDLHLIQAAEEPDMKSKPSRAVICAVTVVIIGLVSCCVVFFKYYFKKQQDTDSVPGAVVPQEEKK